MLNRLNLVPFAIGRVFSQWQGEPSSDAVALRFVAALHFLAITKRDETLTKVFPSSVRTATSAYSIADLKALVVKHEDLILEYLKTPPQTNEVGRSMALLGGFLEVSRRFGPEMDIFEIGASAGLNLLFDHYYYQSDEWSWGDPHSTVKFKLDWSGPQPYQGLIVVRNRAACDLFPVDPSTQKNKLLSYIWPDQFERMQRTNNAIDYAIESANLIEKIDAAQWLVNQNHRKRENRPRVFYHSIIWQYFSDSQKQKFTKAMMDMGDIASEASPLIWLRLEPSETQNKSYPQLKMTVWPEGEEVVLAESGFHGEWVKWLGLAEASK